MKFELRCLSGVSNLALSTGDLPARLKILAWGRNESQIGPVIVNDQTSVALAAQLAGKFFDRIVVDFEHSSEPGHPNFQKPPREHAAYGTLEVVGGDGVYLNALQWTPAGQKFAREYADLSPTVRMEKDGTVSFIKSVALVPNGAVADLSFFGAEIPNKESVMEKFLAAIRKGLGLAETADEAAVEKGLVALVALQAKMTELETKLVALEAKAVANEELVALQAKAGELETKVVSFQAELDKRDRDHVLERARWDGKVVTLSAETIGKMSAKDLQEHVETLAATVPLAARTPGLVAEPTAGQVTENDRTIARGCGLDPAKLK